MHAPVLCRRPFLFAALLFTVLSAGSATAQVCSGFPWTVTATTAGQDVHVHVCGTYVGCLPHAPASYMVDSTIVVTLTQGAPPNCPCPGPPAGFGADAVVTGVPPGTHDLLVYSLDCTTSTLAGQTTVVVGQTSSIPTLDVVGFAALTLLIAGAGIWRLRA